MINTVKKMFNFSENIDASMSETPSSKVSIDEPTTYSSRVSSSKEVADSMQKVKKSLNLIGRQAYEQVKSTI
ncbi:MULTISPECIES: hypothetical protein [Francisella]|uniref:Uncharacterized protein n=1 Tax=Francisella opportunistica TaxID=2016517 RepID=A0A345JSF7_9GAMM|nr:MULTISPECIES: hypothetical protein [Francisella]APC92019.1 hypothetical protein BBG19_1287 [Francisella sp. MA067296]AXH30253.1 hypothetical protein CGC43_06470 [Francisella opportunistica]AXH31894.1 hypothetical protein CGC44_06450 [Francisella opportunistica]AXH33540.1 hypothetical protein CGC45_06460 [Francisella opportunistica]